MIVQRDSPLFSTGSKMSWKRIWSPLLECHVGNGNNRPNPNPLNCNAQSDLLGPFHEVEVFPGYVSRVWKTPLEYVTVRLQCERNQKSET